MHQLTNTVDKFFIIDNTYNSWIYLSNKYVADFDIAVVINHSISNNFIISQKLIF